MTKIRERNRPRNDWNWSKEWEEEEGDHRNGRVSELSRQPRTSLSLGGASESNHSVAETGIRAPCCCLSSEFLMDSDQARRQWSLHSESPLGSAPWSGMWLPGVKDWRGGRGSLPGPWLFMIHLDTDQRVDKFETRQNNRFPSSNRERIR